MTQPDAAHRWDSDQLDLDAYLARTGYRGELTPTLATLRGLQYAHVTSIPFENLEIVLGRPVPLDLESLQDKLVRSRRGGYCYEHTKLFAAVLERLGFDVTGLAARVRMGTDAFRPASHALLRVRTADDPRVWICDIGFGSGPLEPIELADGASVSAGGWEYRIERQTTTADVALWVTYVLLGGRRVDLHSFTVDPRYAVDYNVINYYTSTNPRSPFVGKLFTQAIAPGINDVLYNTTLTVLRPAGDEETVKLTPDDVPDVLATKFGIVLDAEDTAELIAVLGRG